MELHDEQIESYERDGFVLIPDLFREEELTCMRRELPALFAEDSPQRVHEEGSDEVRSVYGSHRDNPVFEALTRLPRLLEPARRLLGGEVYVYQFKINAKQAFLGDTWPWHQDFIFWNKEDGLPAPHLTTVAVFLDEVTEFNGPMLLIPGSHHGGMIAFEANGGSNLAADLKYTLEDHTVTAMVEAGGMVAAKGRAGSALFFHPNTAHASAANISPFSRVLALVTYCRLDNVILPEAVAVPRPEFLAARRAVAVKPLAVDQLPGIAE